MNKIVTLKEGENFYFPRTYLKAITYPGGNLETIITDIDSFLKNPPKASTTKLGFIKLGAGLVMNTDGVVSVSSGGVADSVDWSGVISPPRINDTALISGNNTLPYLGIQSVTDNTLQTESKIIVGAINELKNKVYVPELATSNKIGGIKANSKTDEDTSEVKIGTNGILYITPTPGPQGPIGPTSTKISDVEPTEEAVSVWIKPAPLNNMVVEYNVVDTEQLIGRLKVGSNIEDLYTISSIVDELPITEGTEKTYILNNTNAVPSIYTTATISIQNITNGKIECDTHTIKSIQVNTTSNKIEVVIKTNKTLTDTYKGIIKLIYSKPTTFRTRSISFRVPSNFNIANISVGFAPIKFNKKMAHSLVAADGNNKPYSKLFKYMQGKYVNSGTAWHPNMPQTSDGFMPLRALTYTDGCGVQHRFSLGNSIVPIKDKVGSEYPYDKTDPTASFPYLVWDEIKEMLDYDGSIQFHNMREEGSYQSTGIFYDKTDPVQVKLGLEEVKDYVDSKVRPMYVGAIPDGNMAYKTAFMNMSSVRMLTGGNFSNDINLYSLNLDKFQRGIYLKDSFDLYKANFDSYYTKSNGIDYAAWVLNVLHNIDTEFTSEELNAKLVDYIYDNYGEGGNDSIWFATPDEIYAYKLLCSEATIETVINNNILTTDITYPIYEDMYWEEFTINYNGVGITTLEDILSLGAYGFSYIIKDNNLTININYSKSLEDKAEKYVSLYETSKSEVDKIEALYFVQRLSIDKRIPFTIRINSATESVVLNNITINNGSPTTTESNITVVFSINGLPTHYRLSENESFTGSEWVVYSQTVNFELSKSIGVKTIYAQIKNIAVESNIVSNTIVLQELSPITLLISPGWAYDAPNLGYNADTGISKVRTASAKYDIFTTTGEKYGTIQQDSTSASLNSSSTAGFDTGNNSGDVPDIFLAHCIRHINTADNFIKVNLDIKPGTYSINIIASSKTASPNYLQAIYKLESNGVEVLGIIESEAYQNIKYNIHFDDTITVPEGSILALTVKALEETNSAPVNMIKIVKQ